MTACDSFPEFSIQKEIVTRRLSELNQASGTYFSKSNFLPEPILSHLIE